MKERQLRAIPVDSRLKCGRFYFVQDRRAIDDINAHSSMDTYERLVPEGLMQASVVMATFAYHAAMRDEKLPRVAPPPW